MSIIEDIDRAADYLVHARILLNEAHKRIGPHLTCAQAKRMKGLAHEIAAMEKDATVMRSRLYSPMELHGRWLANNTIFFANPSGLDDFYDRD